MLNEVSHVASVASTYSGDSDWNAPDNITIMICHDALDVLMKFDLIGPFWESTMHPAISRATVFPSVVTPGEFYGKILLSLWLWAVVVFFFKHIETSIFPFGEFPCLRPDLHCISLN